MHTLPVHPSGLRYSQIFLRPEPLGVERGGGRGRGRVDQGTGRLRHRGKLAGQDERDVTTADLAGRPPAGTALTGSPPAANRPPAWAPGHPRAGGLALAAAGLLVGLRLARLHRPDRNLNVSYDRRQPPQTGASTR